MRNFKREKGITLIALIITIIVLLILAGVTLAMIMGDNGIIAKAQTAKERTNTAQDEEEQQLKNLENEIEEYSRNTVTISQEEYQMLKNLNDYTQEDRKIGKWINGSTLYEKLLILDVPSDSDTSRHFKDVYTFSNNIDYVNIDYGKSYLEFQNSNNSLVKNPLTMFSYSSSNDEYFCVICEKTSTGSNIIKYLSQGDNYLVWSGAKNKKIYITIRYTKNNE